MAPIQRPIALASVNSAKAFLTGVDLSSLGDRQVAPVRRLFAAMSFPAVGVPAAVVTPPHLAPHDAPDASATASIAGATASTAGTASIAGAAATPSSATAAAAIGIASGVQQAFVVGNNVIAFDSGVTAERRLATVNSTLLAQLYADKLYPDRGAAGYIANWTASYFNTLANIGWTQQTSNSGAQNLAGSSATVDAAIFSIAASLLGTSGAALVKTILDGLASLSNSNPSFVLFQQQSTSAQVSDFTAGLASNDPSGTFMLDLVEYDVAANEENSQVLFFKWSTTNANVNYRAMNLALDDAVYAQVADAIQQKLGNKATQYVSRLPDL